MDALICRVRIDRIRVAYDLVDLPNLRTGRGMSPCHLELVRHYVFKRKAIIKIHSRQMEGHAEGKNIALPLLKREFPGESSTMPGLKAKSTH